MTEEVASLLHPALQKLAVTHRQRLRLLRLALFMTAAAFLIFALVKALTSQDAGALLLLGVVGLLLVPLVALLGVLMWLLDRRLSRGLHDANQLLRNCVPQLARLTPLGRGDGMGLLARLQLATAHPGLEQSMHVLINPSFRWSSPPLGEVDVRFYCQSLAPEHSWIALGMDRPPLIGKVVDRSAYQRRRRWILALVTGLALAAVIGLLYGAM
ncbi:MAG: hypothetical protein WAT67_10900 [Candidatus Contendobacter sp.]